MFSTIRSVPRKFAKVPFNQSLATPAFHRRAYAVMSQGPTSITEAITHDHRELEQYYNEVINNPSNHDHQQRFGNQFTWELARHSIGEELVVYPAMEKYLGDKGKQMAEEDRKEHHEVSNTHH
jgi:hemerythrin superfamily protein